MRRILYIILFLAATVIGTYSQVTGKKPLVQVNGIITDDENRPVPRASIVSFHHRKGSVSEQSGIYSIISVPGDTLMVSALGYKKITFRIPESFTEKLYKKDLSLVSDTISIEGVTIFPWKTYGQFKQDFLSNQEQETPQIRFMYENLASINATLENTKNYRVSPQAGFRMAMQQTGDAYYTRGQTPANNLLNPFAWARFFNGVKKGLLKNEKSTEKARKAKIKKSSSKSSGSAN